MTDKSAVLQAVSAPAHAADPFAPENLRLSQSFMETAAAVKKLITTVPVRNPTRRILCASIPIPRSARTSP